MARLVLEIGEAQRTVGKESDEHLLTRAGERAEAVRCLYRRQRDQLRTLEAIVSARPSNCVERKPEKGAVEYNCDTPITPGGAAVITSPPAS